MSDLIIIPISLVLLYIGGEGTLRGVLAIAKKFKLSNILVISLRHSKKFGLNSKN